MVFLHDIPFFFESAQSNIQEYIEKSQNLLSTPIQYRKIHNQTSTGYGMFTRGHIYGTKFKRLRHIWNGRMQLNTDKQSTGAQSFDA